MRLTGGEEQAARDAPHTLRHPAGRMLHTAGAARESRDARPAPHTRRDPRELRRSSGALRRLRPPAGTGAPGPRPLPDPLPARSVTAARGRRRLMGASPARYRHFHT